MSALAVELLGDALAAYSSRDAEPARHVWERDADLDSLEGSVAQDLVSQMIEDPRAIGFCAHTLSAARSVERIGDHATNIAETVIYLVTGVTVSDERPRGRGPASIEPLADADAF
jgi:phosphate transport system protein